MARGPRRVAAPEEDESDDDTGVEPMSPNTRRKHDQILIMQADLGTATADFIKTSDIPRPRAPYMPPIVRQCDIAGTAEAALVKGDKPKVNAWSTYGQTEEAQESARGEDPVLGNFQTYRVGIAATKKEEEGKLGRAVTADDTDLRTRSARGGRGGGTSGGKASAEKQRQGHRATQASTSSSLPSPASKQTLKKAGGRTYQARPPLPEYLRGITAPTNPSNMSTIKSQTSTSAVSSGGFARSVPAEGSITKDKKNTTKPTANTSGPSSAARTFLLNGSNFMSAAHKAIEDREKFKGKFPPHGTSIFSFTAGKEPLGLPTQSSGNNHSSSEVDPGRKVPDADLSFVATALLAPGDFSTHTGGAASPLALSGFSEPAETTVSSSIKAAVDAAAKGHVGLGIQGADTSGNLSIVEVQERKVSSTDSLSHNGSLMDSPVPENVSSGVLVADPGEVMVINGVRYVPEAKFLALKELIENAAKMTARTPSLIAGLSPRGVVVEAASPNIEPTSRPLPTPPIAALSTLVTTTVPKENPFIPREPISPQKEVDAHGSLPSASDTNVSPAQLRIRTLDEALVAAALPQSSIHQMSPTWVPSSAALAALPPKPTHQTKTATNNSVSASKWAPKAMGVSTHNSVLQSISINGANSQFSGGPTDNSTIIGDSRHFPHQSISFTTTQARTKQIADDSEGSEL